MRPEGFDTADIRKGAYKVYDSAAGNPDVVIVATGSEVSLAVQAAKTLDSSVKVRVVSMPCVEIFSAQPSAWRDQLVPSSALKVVCEAASPMGWSDALRASPQDIVYVTVQTFGASAPIKVLAEKFGFTASAVADKIRAALSAR
jgi:transketolase